MWHISLLLLGGAISKLVLVFVGRHAHAVAVPCGVDHLSYVEVYIII